MPKYVAFLRAINVGGRTVKMDRLRTLFEEMGLSSVETVIASGNVVFDSTSRNVEALERTIEARLHESLGFEVTTFLRTAVEVAEIVERAPFSVEEGETLYVGFLAKRPDSEAERKLTAMGTADDEFAFLGRELYWLRRKKVSEAAISGTVIEKTLGAKATLRNLTTVTKIATKYA